MKRPATGPPRRPGPGADAAVAAELGAAFPGLVVRVAGTPEMDAIVAAMVEPVPQSRAQASYFEGGRLPVGPEEAVSGGDAALQAGTVDGGP